LARRTRDLKLSALAYERLATVNPEDATPLMQQARALLQLKDFQGARSAAHKALQRDPMDPETFQVLGRISLDEGALKDAIQQFERAVELEPEHGYALNNLGFAYLRANENEKAVLVLEHAAQLLPNVAFVMNNYGVALERLGRTDEAQNAYTQAMDLSPKYVKAMVNSQRLKKLAHAMPAEIDDTTEVTPE
jgi:Flp pilus assembly protein TadD